MVCRKREDGTYKTIETAQKSGCFPVENWTLELWLQHLKERQDLDAGSVLPTRGNARAFRMGTRQTNHNCLAPDMRFARQPAGLPCVTILGSFGTCVCACRGSRRSSPRSRSHVILCQSLARGRRRVILGR